MELLVPLDDVGSDALKAWYRARVSSGAWWGGAAAALATIRLRRPTSARGAPSPRVPVGSSGGGAASPRLWRRTGSSWELLRERIVARARVRWRWSAGARHVLANGPGPLLLGRTLAALPDPGRCSR